MITTPATDTRAAPAPRRPSRLRRAGRAANQYAGVLVVLAVLVVVLGATQPQFLTGGNLIIILETNAVLLVVAVGLTFILLVGGIDLSLGGTMAMSAIGMWGLIDAGVPAWVAIVVVVVAGTAVGALVNGLLIGWVGLSFLVVTIGTASLYRGIANLAAGGQSQSLYENAFLVGLGKNQLFGVPIIVVIAAVVLLVGMFVLRSTGYGRMVYAVGGNAEAARLAGIPIVTIRVSVYAISAGCAALAAVLDAGRLTSASPMAGTGIELTAGAAVLLGGTSFTGGRGTLLGTLLGVLFLGVLQNGLTLAGISPFWTGIVSGVVLIAAIVVDRFRTGRAMP